MKAGVNKLLRTGLMPARAWRIHAVGMSHHEGVKTKETDGSGCGQKSTTSLSLSMEAYGLEEEGGAFHHGHPVLGRRSLDWKMAARTKRSVDETNSRSSDVETGKRTCRSGDV